MLILGLLGMYFDAAVVFVTSQTLLLRLALAILWNSFETRFFLSNECLLGKIIVTSAEAVNYHYSTLNMFHKQPMCLLFSHT